MTESINDLLKRLTDAQAATQRQLAELQQQVTLSQETSTKLVVQKIEEERGYTFRKKGHEKQWRFNKVVDSHLDNALDEIKKLPRSTDENTTKIMENIQEEPIQRSGRNCRPPEEDQNGGQVRVQLGDGGGV